MRLLLLSAALLSQAWAGPITVGRQLETTDLVAAVGFYENYLEAEQYDDVDEQIAAIYRLSEVHKERGHVKSQARTLTTLLEVHAAADEVSEDSGRLVSLAALPALIDEYDQLVSRDLRVGSEERFAAFEAKEVAFWDRCETFAADYPHFEAVTASRFLRAMVTIFRGDAGLAIECPAGLSDEDCWAFEDLLAEQLSPVYEEAIDKSITELRALLAYAAQQKRNSTWVDRARQELTKRRPFEHAIERPELGVSLPQKSPSELISARLDREPYGDFAWIQFQMGERGAAEASLLAMLQEAPNHPKHLAQLADIYISDRNWADAARLLEAAVALDPRNSALHARYGVTLGRSQQWDAAEREYQVALALDPDDPTPHFNRGILWWTLAQPPQFPIAYAAFESYLGFDVPNRDEAERYLRTAKNTEKLLVKRSKADEERQHREAQRARQILLIEEEKQRRLDEQIRSRESERSPR